MKNKILYSILFSLLMIFLFLPLMQKELNIFKIKSLEGVTLKTEKPVLSLNNIATTEYQGAIERYISENFGFRESVIRLYNQYIYGHYLTRLIATMSLLVKTNGSSTRNLLKTIMKV